MLEQDGLCCVMAQAPRMARGDVKALVGSLAQRCDRDSAETRNPSKQVSHVNFLQWAAEQVCGVLAEHGVCEAGRADKTVDFLQSGKHELRECMAQKAPECESFRYALFHCKRGQMDARTRIQGNKPNAPTKPIPFQPNLFGSVPVRLEQLSKLFQSDALEPHMLASHVAIAKAALEQLFISKHSYQKEEALIAHAANAMDEILKLKAAGKPEGILAALSQAALPLEVEQPNVPLDLEGNMEEDQRQTSLLELLAPVRALQPEEILGTAGSLQPWRTGHAKRSVLDKFEHALQ
ncbi:hypothetical protein QJQ45_024660, partial [Haematococcus lacustris]